MKYGFNQIQNNIKELNNDMNNKIDDIKDNIKEVRHEMNENVYNINKNISNLNNLYLISTNLSIMIILWIKKYLKLFI